MNLKVLSKNLFERPDDEHYPSFETILADAYHDRETQSEHEIKSSEILFRAEDTPREGNSPISLQLETGETVGLSHYPLSQIAKASGISTDVLAKLQLKTACQTLNELYSKAPKEERRKLLLTKERIVRAFTTSSYARIWDADHLEDIQDILIPKGFRPTTPTINSDSQGTNIHGNTKPALFRGDRDSWSFFTSPEGSFGDLGNLYKGFLVGNSEVGARSFTARSFLFRGMCANFIIWDVSETDVFRKWHRGTDRNMQIFRLEFQEWLKERSAELDHSTKEAIEIAASTPYIGNGKYDEENAEKAASKIAQLSPMIGKKRARDIIEYVKLPENASNDGDPEISYYSVANALTWAAKEDNRYGSSLTEFGSLAGDLILAASR